MTDDIIRLEDIEKTYAMGRVTIPVLRDITFSVTQGEHVSIMGPSGSGKTTLLNILGCLDHPTAGRYLMEGRDISTFSDDQLSEVRSRKIGFIFQSYNLIPQLTVIENIGIPLFYQGIEDRIIHERSVEKAKLVGLEHRLTHRPTELSGGQQQRVAIARALINDPLMILADEPTGNLDSATGKEIMQLLKSLNETGKTIVLITHDQAIAAFGSRTIHILDGRIVHAS